MNKITIAVMRLSVRKVFAVATQIMAIICISIVDESPIFK
jgi:hypothetical protein